MYDCGGGSLRLTNPPGHLGRSCHSWRDKWTALSGPLSLTSPLIVVLVLLQGSGFADEGSGSRVQGSGFRDEGFGCMVSGAHRPPLIPTCFLGDVGERERARERARERYTERDREI